MYLDEAMSSSLARSVRLGKMITGPDGVSISTRPKRYTLMDLATYAQ